MPTNKRTFTFTYQHMTLGRVHGVAEIPHCEIEHLTKEDVELKSLTNPIGSLPLHILNVEEINRAKLHALNFLTISQKEQYE